jgi:hypothetical protein
VKDISDLETTIEVRHPPRDCSIGKTLRGYVAVFVDLEGFDFGVKCSGWNAKPGVSAGRP